MVAIPFSLIGVICRPRPDGCAHLHAQSAGIYRFRRAWWSMIRDPAGAVSEKRPKTGNVHIHDAPGQLRTGSVLCLLTSTTTIAGLLPLLFEKSLQAQILIPLVISTSFGLMASTTMVLLVIPCMYMILSDLGIVENISVDPDARPDENTHPAKQETTRDTT
jgi:hydrophobic/amphiphilic exporter-1 (mainly G- bacteria), HAE1 family